MTHQLIDYVDAMGKLWGHARRRLDLKLEAWPQSVCARIQDGIPPATFSQQRYPEVFTGEVLKFNIVTHSLPEVQQKVVYVHYVLPLPTRTKYKILHLDRTRYFQTLSCAHRRIANTLEYS